MHAAAANNDNATGAGRRSPSGGVPNSIKFGSHELQCGPSWFGWASFLGASTCSSSMQAPDHLRLPSATLVWSSSSLLMEQQYSRCENIGIRNLDLFLILYEFSGTPSFDYSWWSINFFIGINFRVIWFRVLMVSATIFFLIDSFIYWFQSLPLTAEGVCWSPCAWNSGIFGTNDMTRAWLEHIERTFGFNSWALKINKARPHDLFVFFYMQFTLQNIFCSILFHYLSYFLLSIVND